CARHYGSRYFDVW
nr:immunoglobulin heavy chain junction region [Mus musculus]